MRRWLISLVLWGLSGCIEPLPVSAPDTSPLALGESRVVELYALRLDVRDYEQTLTKADILALPKSLQDELWLLDLDLTGGSGSPLLMDNALHAIAQLDLDDASLSQAEKNMVRILQMTPDTASLEGTPLAELLNLAPKVGISPAQVLADSMGVGVESAFMRPWALTEALVEGLVATHPNAQTRPGPVSEDCPDGRIPVSENFCKKLDWRVKRYENEVTRERNADAVPAV